MQAFLKFSINLLIVSLCAIKIQCTRAEGRSEVKETSFIYDTAPVELLLAKINEINERLLKNEERQDYQQKEIAAKFNQIIESVGVLKDRVSEQSAKITLMSQRVSELDERFNETSKAISQGFESLNHKFEDLQRSERETSAAMFNKISGLNETLVKEDRRCPKSEKYTEVSPEIYSSCKEALKAKSENAVYLIRKPHNDFSIFKAFCLKDPKGGDAWTVIQRRQEDSGHFIDFKRNWRQYKDGFGDPNYDHWLGLEAIFALTNSTTYELWIHFVNERGVEFDSYRNMFRIANETQSYSIVSLGKHTGHGSPSDTCLGSPFVTFDRESLGNIVANGGAGYWKNCGNLNSQSPTESGSKINLYAEGVRINYIHMAIRSKEFYSGPGKVVYAPE